VSPKAAADSGEIASAVLGAAGDLSTQSDVLRSAAGSFVKEMKSA
jgi:hypothetical protein